MRVDPFDRDDLKHGLGKLANGTARRFWRLCLYAPLCFDGRPARSDPGLSMAAPKQSRIARKSFNCRQKSVIRLPVGEHDTVMNTPDEKLLAYAAQIVSAHVAHNLVSTTALPRLIQDVVQSLRTAQLHGIAPERPKPAVPIQQSIQRDSIACLECGKRFRTLKRHLEREHNMTDEEYRLRWQLPASYKLTAPEYAELRADVARKIGLGRKPRGRGKR
ncbi:MAG TPA: MucR family transcriptional regulator [Acetobacteraceae bacterium]|nr:MucR family transcriptional regulator [Acetobacteraceae bacterium]